jgi:hypothetical protein
MPGTDGFRNRAAPVVIAGDPSAGHVVIDATGIHVYDNTGALVAQVLTGAASPAGLVGVVAGIDGAFLRLAVVDDFTADPGGANLLWEILDTGAGPILQLVPAARGLSFSPTGELSSTPVGVAIGLLQVPRGLPAATVGVSSVTVAEPATSSAATSLVSAETKDGGVGDYQFEAYAGRWYEVRYSARGAADTANTTMDVVIRDGGGSSPTTASPGIAATSLPLPIVSPGGNTGFKIADPVQFTAGTHTLAAFYRRTAGAGLVNLGQSSSGARSLHVVDIGADA